MPFRDRRKLVECQGALLNEDPDKGGSDALAFGPRQVWHVPGYPGRVALPDDPSLVEGHDRPGILPMLVVRDGEVERRIHSIAIDLRGECRVR